MNTRQQVMRNRIIALVIVAIIAAAVIVHFVNPPTPAIVDQSCSQLVDTLHDIMRREGPDQSFATQRDAALDAETLNVRVEALGGCPGYKALQ